MLRRYEQTGEALTCEPLTQGLLNRGYRLATTHGRYFLKHHLDADAAADRAAIARQHHATLRLRALGLPVAPPVADGDGRTVAVVGGRCYALHPWVEGRHRDGAELSEPQSRRLGTLLGRVHTCLEEVMPGPQGGGEGPWGGGEGPPHAPAASAPPDAAARAEDTFALIEELLKLVRSSPRDIFGELAEHRLVERRALLERHAHRRPAPSATPARGWVHGDFHPLNLLYRGGEPAAIVDWDRLGVQPRAEEAVRAAAIFFVRPGGTLDLVKVRAYARAYRATAGADSAELAAAAHRVWWERLNDFWMLRWRYQLDDRRADPGFPASSALSVWWTREYAAVRGAFCD
ncbi:phosphotransferase [Streptomyces sp. NPDC057654]|uniref:phosphotransferase n=1 Tax=Streptomyces sp. NPDC057654 TaxID=3346196 RepID=UPI0036C1E069